MGAFITSAKAAPPSAECACPASGNSGRSTGLPVVIASPIVPATGIVRPTSSSGSPSTARQTSSVPPGSSVQQSAASALTRARSSETRRSITTSKRRSLVSASPAFRSASCSARRRSLSRSRRDVSSATAASRATASASAISPGLQSPTIERWKASTPSSRSCARIGVASTACTPCSESLRTSPRLPSSSAGVARTSATATVRRRRAERLTTGSRDASPSGDTPSASHSAAKPVASPDSPSLTKQRAASSMTPISASTAGSTSSTLRRDRSSSETCEISRSRSSASASAIVARERSSASPPSLTKACIRPSSSSSKTRGRRTAPKTTPITSSAARTGT